MKGLSSSATRLANTMQVAEASDGFFVHYFLGNLDCSADFLPRKCQDMSGQIITTSAEVTLNCGLVRESPKIPLIQVGIWPRPSRGVLVIHLIDRIRTWAMACDAIPPDLLGLLQEFEIYGKGPCDLFQSRHNIILDDISTTDLTFGTILTGIPIMAEGATKDMFQAGFFPIGADQVLSEPRNNVLLTSGMDDIPTTGKVLLWNVRGGFEEIFPHPIHWICDSDTMVIPLDARGSQHVKVLEMFAGGYGGWASAFKFLRSQQQLPCQIIGIEDDFETALAYSLNHSATIVDGLHTLPRGFFKSTTNDYIIHGNVRSRNWWNAVAVWSPHIVTISSPCPPWTGASHSPGLHSSQGMLLPEALAILRIFRPPLVAIEQVHGFATHPHRRHCIGVLKSSGYEIAFAKVVDSAQFGACHRLRWLCVWPFDAMQIMSRYNRLRCGQACRQWHLSHWMQSWSVLTLMRN